MNKAILYNKDGKKVTELGGWVNYIEPVENYYILQTGDEDWELVDKAGKQVSILGTFSGYQVMYATNKKFTKGKKIKTVRAKSASLTIKKLKAKKIYYFKIRAYKTSGKNKICGSWSSVKYVKVKK